MSSTYSPPSSTGFGFNPSFFSSSSTSSSSSSSGLTLAKAKKTFLQLSGGTETGVVNFQAGLNTNGLTDTYGIITPTLTANNLAVKTAGRTFGLPTVSNVVVGTGGSVNTPTITTDSITSRTAGTSLSLPTVSSLSVGTGGSISTPTIASDSITTKTTGASLVLPTVASLVSGGEIRITTDNWLFANKISPSTSTYLTLQPVTSLTSNGNITSTSGSITATSGSISAPTGVVSGKNLIATTQMQTPLMYLSSSVTGSTTLSAVQTWSSSYRHPNTNTNLVTVVFFDGIKNQGGLITGYIQYMQDPTAYIGLGGIITKSALSFTAAYTKTGGIVGISGTTSLSGLSVSSYSAKSASGCYGIVITSSPSSGTFNTIPVYYGGPISYVLVAYTDGIF